MKKRTEKRTPPAGNAPAGGKIYLPALSAPNSRLGQTEKSQNSPSEKVRNMQKNPAEINRFQPDLVGVLGFEPEASWSRRLVGYFSRTFQGISAPFRSENFTAASFPARINPPDFSAFGSRFGSERKTSGAKTAPL